MSVPSIVGTCQDGQMTQRKHVRDRIPEIMTANGERAVARRLTDEEYEPALLDKLLEESHERVRAESRQDRPQEAADVYEVLAAIARLDGFAIADTQAAADQKPAERGGFAEKVRLDLW